MASVLDLINADVEKREANIAEANEYERQRELEEAAERQEFIEVLTQHQKVADLLVETMEHVGVRKKLAPTPHLPSDRIDIEEYITLSNPINLGRLQVADSGGRTHGFAEIEIRTKQEERYVEPEQPQRRWRLPKPGRYEAVDSGEITAVGVSLYAGTEAAQELVETKQTRITDLTEKKAAVDGDKCNLRHHIKVAMSEDREILEELSVIATEVHERALESSDASMD